MSVHSECMLCLCTKSVLVQTGVRHAIKVEVRRCTECGLVFLWPRPSPSGLDWYYTEQYRQDYADSSVNERYKTDLDEARLRVHRLLPFFQRDTSVLEVGCGSGAFIDSIRAYVGEVVGVEPDEPSQNLDSGLHGITRPTKN